MRKTDSRPSVLAIPLAVILAIGARPAAGQIPTAVGPENIGCATPPISLVVSATVSGLVIGPSPAGFGTVNGVFLFWPAVPAPAPLFLLSAATGFGTAGGCCFPGPATIYSCIPIAIVSPSEVLPIPPYDPSLYGMGLWIQELIVRPASPFVPCTIYVTNQKLFSL